MVRTKFPNLIHVTREKESNGDTYLIVREGGVFDVETDGEPIAVYKRFAIGKVEIKKQVRFVGK